MNTSEKKCKNCDFCEIGHANRNITFYECKNDDCLVEPDDYACDCFVMRKSDTSNKNK